MDKNSQAPVESMDREVLTQGCNLQVHLDWSKQLQKLLSSYFWDFHLDLHMLSAPLSLFWMMSLQLPPAYH